MRAADASRAWSLIRLAALPVVYLGERLVDHPAPHSAAFPWTLAATALWAVVALAGAYGWIPLRPPYWLVATLDLAAISALTYTSGGPFSQLRYAFFLLPVGAAVLLRPALTALASLASVGAYLAVSLLYPAPPDAGEFELTQAAYLAWLGAAAVLLSQILSRRTDEVAALSASRGRLVAQALDAEDRERRRLAEALHDEAVQNLLAARQELAGGPDRRDLDLVRRGLERTVDQLRQAVFDLHPAVLEHAGLAAALRAVTERAARRAGMAWQVEVDRDAGAVRDQLVFSVVRELLANAVTHAGAGRVEVRVGRSAGELVAEVHDDGRGLDPERLRQAPAEGHIGLASVTERVEAVGGALEIATRPGEGTLVRVRLPLAEAAPGNGRRPAPPRPEAVG